jgi:cbb3-type cytochrome oxidase cytochrome c subunit
MELTKEHLNRITIRTTNDFPMIHMLPPKKQLPNQKVEAWNYYLANQIMQITGYVGST